VVIAAAQIARNAGIFPRDTLAYQGRRLGAAIAETALDIGKRI
jgi:hypothetical protein